MGNSMSALKGISSMATRLVLQDMVSRWVSAGRMPAEIESVGGVEARQRIEAGEQGFDAVFLASSVIDALIGARHVQQGSRIDLMASGIAVAVPQGEPEPPVDSEAALRQAVLEARGIGFSTGPSGTALLAILERWGVADVVRERLVQAPPGVPVGELVAQGRVSLGFQQFSELMNVPGIALLGMLPESVQVRTVFSAGVTIGSAHSAETRQLLDFMASPAVDDIRERHGMMAVSAAR